MEGKGVKQLFGWLMYQLKRHISSNVPIEPTKQLHSSNRTLQRQTKYCLCSKLVGQVFVFKGFNGVVIVLPLLSHCCACAKGLMVVLVYMSIPRLSVLVFWVLPGSKTVTSELTIALHLVDFPAMGEFCIDTWAVSYPLV